MNVEDSSFQHLADVGMVCFRRMEDIGNTVVPDAVLVTRQESAYRHISSDGLLDVYSCIKNLILDVIYTSVNVFVRREWLHFL